jgi:glycosyltransferase involved in cell wall biosynthesis
VVFFWTHYFPDKKIVSYLRRYEVWEKGLMEGIKFEHVDAMIFVSKYIWGVFRNIWEKKVGREYFIPNGLDLSEWPLRDGGIPRTGKNIAMVCQFKNVKNIPLAVQILKQLPSEYKIHHCGLPISSQYEGQIESYIQHSGLGDRFLRYGKIHRNEIARWLLDKDTLLSTSINEGNPNNIIEAMAMGIRPVIHNWPGVEDQFPREFIFDTVDQAVHAIQIDNTSFTPEMLREYVIVKYPVSNFDALHNVIETVHNDESVSKQRDRTDQVRAEGQPGGI